MHPDKWRDEITKLVYSSVDQQVIRVNVGGELLMVEVASTPMTRTAGLSNRDSIPHDGMLFMYDGDSLAPYHRTNMQFDIAIRFFDRDGALVHEDLSSQVVECPVPYRYVLETLVGRELSGTLVVHGF